MLKFTFPGEQDLCLPFFKPHLLAASSSHDHPLLQVANIILFIKFNLSKMCDKFKLSTPIFPFKKSIQCVENIYFLFQNLQACQSHPFNQISFFSHKRPKYQNNQHQFPISISKTLFSVLNIFYFLLFRIYKEAKRHRAAIRFRLNGFPKTHKFFFKYFPQNS